MLVKTTDMLLMIRGLEKLYDQYIEKVRRDHQLSHMEIKIISFLYNNPGKDTAADIAELRMLPKGNISKAVESLIKKGLLYRIPDQKDRRKVHLGLRDSVKDMAAEIDLAKERYERKIFHGISKDELELYFKVNSQILGNTLQGLKGEKNE